MKVIQILNNNIAIVRRGGNEIIVDSLGVAFNKKIGDEITEEEIQKVYVLDSQDMLEHFSYLLVNSDEKKLAVLKEIISYGEEELDQKANDYLRLTLLDHISFALKRAKKGQFIKSPLAWEVQKFYPKYLEIGEFAVNLLNKEYDLEFPEDEAVSIALHFVNLQEGKNGLQEALESMKSVRDIISIIKYHFRIVIDEKGMNYMRLVTHLQYFMQRIVQGESYNSNDTELNRQISSMYKEAYACVQKIRRYIDEKYSVKISMDEETYLILHVHRVTNRSEGE